MNHIHYLFLLVLTTQIACTSSTDEQHLFRYVPSAESGLDFNNQIEERDSFHILDFHYLYNGGGVGIGDFNNDGLPDVVFSGNQVASKIYLNKGNLQFQDITEVSNFQSKSWTTGVSIVDINADGWQDIYLSVGGLTCKSACQNQLFIHQGLDKNGVPTFLEKATEYGLNDGLYTQQAAFFDYDRDGDLDVYLLHNIIDPKDKNVPKPKRRIDAGTKDQLLQNNYNETKGHPIFADVSEALDTEGRGYGLGITINDFNQDGWPDIYVANDFLSDDLLFLNLGEKATQNTHFQEVSKKYLAHTTYNGMGVEVADVNNDALPDILVVDMLPNYHERQKTMVGFMNYDKFQLAQRQGYTAQFMRNTLQIHNGLHADSLRQFSEVGYYAGIYNTDWSWSPLLADFDNDGDRDLYITNGYVKDITDLDFINYSNEATAFGTPESRKQAIYDAVEKMEGIKLNNFFFSNEGDLKFADQSNSWMPPKNSYSNGAAYADLDLDGDLDILVNNINDNAFLLENQSAKTTYFTQIKLVGTKANSSAIGAQATVFQSDKTQTHYQSPVRGYLSTVTDILHVGLGNNSVIDSIKVLWPNGKTSKKISPLSNQLLTFKSEEATPETALSKNNNALIFSELGNKNTFNYTHKENYYSEYNGQHLLLTQHTQLGPCFAVANIDGKPGEELFIGGAKGEVGRIFFQNDNQKWRSIELSDSPQEDTDAAFFDADKDGDLDLYVVSGGSEFLANAAEYKDRLYLNDGQGNFTKASNQLAVDNASGSCVVPIKSRSENTHLFVGSNIVPRQYPTTPRSQLLVQFQEKVIANTDKFAYGLSTIGMVTDAKSANFSGNEQEDLLVVGEWMQPTLFAGSGDHLEQKALQFFNEKNEKINPLGLWRSIEIADVNNDGNLDFIAGNLGENTRLQAFENEPITLYTGDLDDNGSPDPLVGQYYQNKSGERHLYPIHARDDVVKQLPKIKQRYRTYAEFSRAKFNELLPDLENNQLTVNTLASCYFENIGQDSFRVHRLPTAAQLAPVNAILLNDFDKDGNIDVLLAGNDYTAESNGGWHDASTGVFLRGDGEGNFEASKSNFYAPGEVRDMIQLTDKNGQQMIVVGVNDGDLKVFKY